MSLKQKNIALLIGFFIFLWFSYQFSIANTLEAKRKYNNLIDQKELLINIPQKINYLKQENKYLDSLLETNKINIESSFQNNLLQILNAYATKNQLKIVTFNEPHQIC